MLRLLKEPQAGAEELEQWTAEILLSQFCSQGIIA